MRPPGACVVFTAVLVLAFAAPLCAQEEWEGKIISDVVAQGFIHESRQKNMEVVGLKKGDKMTREKKDLAIKELFKTGKFEDVQIPVVLDPADKNKVIVTIQVTEYIIVEKV